MSVAERYLASSRPGISAAALLSGKKTYNDFYCAEASMSVQSSTLTSQNISDVLTEAIASAKDQIVPVLQFSSNWDGYGAKAPDSMVVAAAIQVLASLQAAFHSPNPIVSPSRTGGISLEWDEENAYMEIEIERTSNIIDSTNFYEVSYFYKSRIPDLPPVHHVVPLSAFVQEIIQSLAM